MESTHIHDCNTLAKLFDIQNTIAQDLSVAMPLETAFAIVIKHFTSFENILGGAFYSIQNDGSLMLEKSINFNEEPKKHKHSYASLSPENALVYTGETKFIKLPSDYDYFHIQSFNINATWFILSPVRLNGDIIGALILLGKDEANPFLLKAVENASYKIGGVIGRIEFENEITEKQQSFERIFQNMHDILIITNKDGKIIYFNQLLPSKTGYLDEELYTLEISQLFPDELAFDIKKLLNEIISKESKLILYPLLNSNREIIPAESIVSKVVWNGRNMFLWNIRDLKDRKEAQEAIAIEKKKAEIANNAKTAFLTNLSYSLRIPLSSVLGMTELLLKTDLNKNQFNYLNIITRSAEQLMLIANQLLDISIIEKGEMTLETKTFSLKDTIIQVINQQYYKAYNKGLEIICDYVSYGQDLVLKGDSLRLSQILQNLVDNAVKFTDNGKIELHINPTHYYENGVRIQFVVRDTGRGMTTETVKSILEACKQKSPVARPNNGDFGLGLIIAYNLIALMGGELNISSELHRGTTMSFELLLNIGQIHELQIGQSEDAFSSNTSVREQVRVIVAEDQPFNQMVVKNMLEDFGFKVDCVDNGQQLIDKIINQQYDVILMDIYMPIMDGIAATKYIRTKLNKPVCDTPIIAITANAYINEHQKYLEAGVNDTISKPFKSQLLYSKIMHHIGLAKAQAIKDNRILEFDISKSNVDKFYNLDLLYNITKNQKNAIIKMLQVFIEKTHIELTQLEEYVLNKDWQNVAGIAHKMKPSLAYLSMKQVEELIQQIYYLSKNNEQTDRIPKLLANAKAILDFVIHQLQEEIKRLSE
ncbi:MAG: response regulator [Bacteroidales bacterium]|nr:response regulator [Bacteroidales bacterium]